MTAATTMMMVASAAIAAAGAIQQGKAQKDMADYNSQVAQNEAIAERQKADYEEVAHRRNLKKLEGTQRANIAASGGELLDAGDVMDMTTEEAELDALAIRYGGQTAQDAKIAQSNMYKMQGAAAKSAGYFKAGSTLLTAGSKVV